MFLSCAQKVMLRAHSFAGRVAGFLENFLVAVETVENLHHMHGTVPFADDVRRGFERRSEGFWVFPYNKPFGPSHTRAATHPKHQKKK